MHKEDSYMSYTDPEVEQGIGLSQDRSKFCMLQVFHLFIWLIINVQGEIEEQARMCQW